MRTRTIGTTVGRHAFLARLGPALVSAGLVTLAFDPAGWAPIAWVALVPFLCALGGSPPFQARAVGFLFGYVFYGAGVSWLFLIFGPATVGLVGVLAAGLWLFGLAFHRLEARWGTTTALLLAPVAWVAIDLFRSELWPLRFSWMQLGFSQASNPALLQSVSLVGVYGLTLAIVLANALVALAWRRHGATVGGLAAGAALLLACAAQCTPLPRPLEEPGRPLRVAAVQQERVDPLADARAVNRGGEADLICWPEYAFAEDPREDARTWGEVGQAARESGAVLVIGIREGIEPSEPTRERQLFHNAALVIGPDGQPAGIYRKHHPIQFFRDGLAGRSLRPIATSAGLLGIAICYDMTFSHVTRTLAGNGAAILVVPALDDLPWGALERRQHARMAQARAVEHRRWLVRPTTYGISQIVDPRGRERARASSEGPTVLRAEARLREDRTLHDRGAWLLPYACLALLAAYLGWEAAVALAARRGARRG